MIHQKEGFVDVIINWSEEEGVTVDPDPVTLKFNYTPHSINWIVKSAPPQTKLKIVWGEAKGQQDVICPFRKVKPHPEKREILQGTDNKKVKDEYQYTVLFVDNKGQVVAGKDPGAINLPGP